MNAQQINYQREVDEGIVDLANHLNEVKLRLKSLLHKIEFEQLNWPSVLDCFSVLSGQMNILQKRIKETPSIRNLLVVPYLLSPEVDMELFNLTEGRLKMFDHEAAPLYLRTKLDPGLKEKERIISSMGVQSKQSIDQYNRLLDQCTNQVQRAQDETTSIRREQTCTHKSDDTNNLVAFMFNGYQRNQASISIQKQDICIQPPAPTQPLGSRAMIRTSVRSSGQAHNR